MHIYDMYESRKVEKTRVQGKILNNSNVSTITQYIKQYVVHAIQSNQNDNIWWNQIRDGNICHASKTPRILILFRRNILDTLGMLFIF